MTPSLFSSGGNRTFTSGVVLAHGRYRPLVLCILIHYFVFTLFSSVVSICVTIIVLSFAYSLDLTLCLGIIRLIVLFDASVSITRCSFDIRYPVIRSLDACSRHCVLDDVGTSHLPMLERNGRIFGWERRT